MMRRLYPTSRYDPCDAIFRVRCGTKRFRKPILKGFPCRRSMPVVLPDSEFMYSGPEVFYGRSSDDGLEMVSISSDFSYRHDRSSYTAHRRMPATYNNSSRGKGCQSFALSTKQGRRSPDSSTTVRTTSD